MAKTDITKTTPKLSQKLTKDFAKLVKAFVRDTGQNTESARAEAAYVLGCLDASSGIPTSWGNVPEGHLASYWQGWKNALGEGKAPTKRKGRPRKL